MRWLIIFLLLTAPAMAELVPTGTHTWLTEDGREHRAVGYDRPLNYYDDGWKHIVPDWEQVNDTTWKVVKGNHRLFAFADGRIYYVVPRAGVRHAVGLNPTKLIKFNKLDSTYAVLFTADYDSISVDGVRLTYHNIFPGVDRVCVYDNWWYKDKWIFKQESRDTLGEHGPWADYLVGTAGQIDLDSLNLDIYDRDGEFAPNVVGRLTDGWFECRKDDTAVFALATTTLWTEDSVTAVPVHKRIVVLGGTPWFVELFNPAPTVSWPDGPIYHDAIFGHDTTQANPLDLEDYVRAYNIELDNAYDGYTADSVTGYVATTTAHKLTRCAIYSRASGLNFDQVDTTTELSIRTDAGDHWKSFPLQNAQALTGATRYGICMWSEDKLGASSLYYHATDCNNDDSLGNDFLIYDTWPDPLVCNNMLCVSRISIYCYISEEAAEAGQVIIIGANDEKEDVIPVCLRDVGWNGVGNRLPDQRNDNIFDH